MKKLLFLLLSTVTMYGQAVFDEGIQVTGNTATAETSRIGAFQLTGELNYLNATDLPISTATQTALDSKIGGTGTINTFPVFTSSGTLGNSSLTQDASGNVSLGASLTPLKSLTVWGNISTIDKSIFTGNLNASIVYTNRLQLQNNSLIAYSGSTSGNVIKATSTGFETGLPMRYATDVSGSFTPRSFIDLGFFNSNVSTATQTALQGVYSGQTWGVLGDSFGQLGIYQPALLSKLGITTITNAQGGACITGGTEYIEGDGLSRVPLVDRIDSMLLNSITGIIIQGGSNDFHYNTNIGFFGSTDTNTMYGALDYICSKIANHPTKLKAVFITPTFRGDTQKFGGSTGLANYEKMKPYVTAIKMVASKYSIQVVDEFGAGINYYNTDVYTTDGIHPNNATGEELYNNFLISNINSGTLDVPTLEVIASYEEYPTFRKSIYWNKSGGSLINDAAITVTNGVDTDLKVKVTAIGDSNKHASISTAKTGVPLILQEFGEKVGIGTTSPNRKLTLSDTQTYMALNSTSFNRTSIGSDAIGCFVVYDDTNSAYRLVIQQSTGNIGIGTETPASKLEVAGNVTATGFKTPTGTNTKFLLDGGSTVLAKDIDFSGLPTYTNNADAISGGVAVGKLYQTASGDVKIVH